MKDEELDLDESMAATMAEISEREAEDEPETEAPDVDSGDADEEVSEPIAAEDASEETVSEDESEDEVDSEESVEQKEEVTATGRNPPLSWRPSAKEKWNKLDPIIQDEILKREEDTSKGAQMLKEKASYGDRVQSAVSPYMAMIQSKGGTVEQFIQGMGNTYYRLTTGSPQERAATIQNLARSAGVDLSQIQPPSAQDQQLSPLYGEIQTLKQQLNQQNQQRAQQEDFAINQALTAFESETDENGLKHPYFSNVENEMIAIIPQIRQNNPSLSHIEVLNQAYDNSIWANPETRQLLQVQQDRKIEAERKRKAKEDAAKAQKANKVNLRKGGEHTPSQAKPTGTIDEEMAATMKKIQNR